MRAQGPQTSQARAFPTEPPGTGRGPSPWIAPLAPGILRLPDPVVVDAQGHAERMLDFTKPPLATGPITSYSTWRFQAWYRDPVGPLGTGVNTSDALRVTFCP